MLIHFIRVHVFQDSLDTKACWGYEQGCKEENAFSIPHCPGDHKGWVATKKAQLDTYYAQGDFGYVRDQRREMILLCEPLFVVSSLRVVIESWRHTHEEREIKWLSWLNFIFSFPGGYIVGMLGAYEILQSKERDAELYRLAESKRTDAI